jgi:hypothetical protein
MKEPGIGGMIERGIYKRIDRRIDVGYREG